MQVYECMDEFTSVTQAELTIIEGELLSPAITVDAWHELGRYSMVSLAGSTSTGVICESFETLAVEDVMYEYLIDHGVDGNMQNKFAPHVYLKAQ